MSRINIANYLIGELSEEKHEQQSQDEHQNIIDNIVDTWSRKEYLNPDKQEKSDT